MQPFICNNIYNIYLQQYLQNLHRIKSNILYDIQCTKFSYTWGNRTSKKISFPKHIKWLSSCLNCKILPYSKTVITLMRCCIRRILMIWCLSLILAKNGRIFIVFDIIVLAAIANLPYKYAYASVHLSVSLALEFGNHSD